jgi:hypothetical protein
MGLDLSWSSSGGGVRKNRVLLLAGVVSAMITGAANAAVSITIGSPTYVENFDIMGTAGTAPPPNWIAGNFNPVSNNQAAPPNTAVSSVALMVDNGSDATKGFNYNLGSTGATDRALGLTATTSSGDRMVQVEFTNNTGAPITSFNVSYTGEQWSSWDAVNSTDKLFMFYSTSNAGPYVLMGTNFDFQAPVQGTGTRATLDGNAAGNRVTGIGGTFTPASPIPNGGTFVLNWFDRNDSGNDTQRAIDDLTVTVPLVPEPATIGLGGIAALGMLARRRRNA